MISYNDIRDYINMNVSVTTKQAYHAHSTDEHGNAIGVYEDHPEAKKLRAGLTSGQVPPDKAEAVREVLAMMPSQPLMEPSVRGKLVRVTEGSVVIRAADRGAGRGRNEIETIISLDIVAFVTLANEAPQILIGGGR